MDRRGQYTPPTLRLAFKSTNRMHPAWWNPDRRIARQRGGCQASVLHPRHPLGRSRRSGATARRCPEQVSGVTVWVIPSIKILHPSRATNDEPRRTGTHPLLPHHVPRRIALRQFPSARLRTMVRPSTGNRTVVMWVRKPFRSHRRSGPAQSPVKFLPIACQTK